MADEQQLQVAKSEPLPQQQLSVTKSEPPYDPVGGAAQATSLRADDRGPIRKALDSALAYAGGVATGAGQELGSKLAGATELIGEGLNKIPGIGETLAPRAGLEGEKAIIKKADEVGSGSSLPGQGAGAVAEDTAEWMAGDAALKALGKLGMVAKNAPHLLKLAEKYPTVAKLLMGAGKGATIGAAEGGAKAAGSGDDVDKGAVAGAEGGAAGGAVGGAVGEVLDAVAGSKTARGLVNRSLGASARDVTYGNPAKALLDESIITPVTGDVEAYKTALRAGKTPVEAAQAAGGRIAAVSAKLNEYEPQLTTMLKASPAKIAVKDAILDPIYEATSDIINNRAIDADMKDAAIDKILAVQKEMLDGLGKNIDPETALKIKRDVGDRINWTGTSALPDELKSVYRKLYGSLKQSIHQAVPEAAPLDEKLTNLMAAWGDLNPGKAGSLPLKEEVEAGTGPMSGGFKGVMGRLEAVIGRFVPGAARVVKSPVTKATVGEAGVITFEASDGSRHSVPADKLDDARKIDPDLKVIDQ